MSLSAIEAKDLSKNYILNMVFSVIKIQAEEGRYDAYVPRHLDEYTIKALEHLGYTVENITDDKSFYEGILIKKYVLDIRKYCMVRWEK